MSRTGNTARHRRRRRGRTSGLQTMRNQPFSSPFERFAPSAEIEFLFRRKFCPFPGQGDSLSTDQGRMLKSIGPRVHLPCFSLVRPRLGTSRDYRRHGGTGSCGLRNGWGGTQIFADEDADSRGDPAETGGPRPPGAGCTTQAPANAPFPCFFGERAGLWLHRYMPAA